MGAPRQIVEVVDAEHGLVRVAVGEATKDVSAAILMTGGESVAVGEWVDVHLGFALDKLTEDEAREALEWLDDLAAAEPFGGPLS